MKVIRITDGSAEIHQLLDEASDDDVVVCLSDGREFILSAVGDFDREVARTRQNAKLMALLDERAKQSRTVSLSEAKRQLGLAP